MASALAWSDVRFRYTDKMPDALSIDSWKLDSGSLTAVIGPNGAGKTTLLRLLSGRITPRSGELRWQENWLDASGRLDRHHLGLLIENPGVYRRLTVWEYLRFCGSFYKIADLDQRITDDCARMGLALDGKRLDALSLGNRQKVQLVRSLLHRPALALLDEPVSNLDPQGRELFWNWLRDLHAQGTTIVLCSHVLGEIQDLCSHVAFLAGGRLLATGTLSEVLKTTGRKPHTHCVFADGTQADYAVDDPWNENPALLQDLVAQGRKVVEMRIEQPTLADVYRDLLGAP